MYFKNNILTFVHTFDPFYPTLFGEIKSNFHKLQTNFETKPMFEKTILIESLSNSKNLKRMFQHSKFDFSGHNLFIPKGVTKCGSTRCKTCENILVTNSVYFKQTGVTFQIKSSMNCLARNVIYYIICNKCQEDHVG